jgi:hypothetical protein
LPTGLLGISFIIFGLVLLLRGAPSIPSLEVNAASGVEASFEPTFDWRRTLLSLGLCLGYAAGLLGRGLPYGAVTFGFLFLHMVLLDETESVPAKPTLRRAIVAAALAAGVTIAVSLVFEKLFLVRLP